MAISQSGKFTLDKEEIHLEFYHGIAGNAVALQDFKDSDFLVNAALQFNPALFQVLEKVLHF